MAEMQDKEEDEKNEEKNEVFEEIEEKVRRGRKRWTTLDCFKPFGQAVAAGRSKGKS